MKSSDPKIKLAVIIAIVSLVIATVSLGFGVYKGIKDLELTGLFSQVYIGDTDKINLLTDQKIGKNIYGTYVEAAYHAGRKFLTEDKNLVIFVRHELFNTQYRMATGFKADPKNDRKVTTIGTAYFPISSIAVKFDIERWKDGTDKSWGKTNLGIGYLF